MARPLSLLIVAAAPTEAPRGPDTLEEILRITAGDGNKYRYTRQAQ